MSAPPTEAQVAEAYTRVYHFSVGNPPEPAKVAEQKKLIDEYTKLEKEYTAARTAVAAAPARPAVAYTDAPKPAPPTPKPAPLTTPIVVGATGKLRVTLRGGDKDVDAADILTMDQKIYDQSVTIGALKSRITALTTQYLLVAREDVELRERLKLQSTAIIDISKPIMDSFRKAMTKDFIKGVKDGTKAFNAIGAAQTDEYLTTNNIALDNVSGSTSTTATTTTPPPPQTKPPPSPTQVPGPGVPQEVPPEQEDASAAPAELATVTLKKGNAVADAAFVGGISLLTDDEKKAAVKVTLFDESKPASWFPMFVELATGDIEKRYNATFQVPKDELASLLVGEARKLMLDVFRNTDPTAVDADIGAEPSWALENGNIVIYITLPLDDNTFRINVMSFVNAVIATYLRGVQEAGDNFTPSTNVAAYKAFHQRIANAFTNTVVPLLNAVMLSVKTASGANWNGYRSAFAKVVQWLFMKIATGTDYGNDGRRQAPWPPGAKRGDWFVDITNATERNTLVAPTRMPPLVAALMYDKYDSDLVAPVSIPGASFAPTQTELALMLPLFALVAEYPLKEVGASGNSFTFPSPTSTAYGQFFEQFFGRETKTNNLVFARTASLGDFNGKAQDIAEKSFLAKKPKPGESGLEISAFGTGDADIPSPRTFYALAARDLETRILPQIASNYKQGKQRALALLAVVWSFMIPFKVPGGTTYSSLFTRMAQRPRLKLDNNDQNDITTIKSATDAREQTTKTDAFADRFRSTLSSAIIGSKYSTNASRFIEDAKTIVDEKTGKTLFELIDDASSGRQYSVFIPDNIFWSALQARVPDTRARVRVMKRHVIWGPAPYDFSKVVDTRFAGYSTLLSLDNAADSDGSILLATVKMGRKNKQTGLLVKYPNNGRTDEIEIISEPSRAKTGRPYFIAGVFWLDGPGLAPSVGAYQSLPPPPQQGGGGAGEKSQYVPMKQLQTAIKPQSPLSDQEQGDIQRETVDMLRKTGAYDAVLSLAKQGDDDIVIFLPPKSTLAAYYATKPSADEARQAGLYHVITAKDFLQALNACVDEKKSLRIDTVAGPTLKFACGENKKAKPGRVLASDITKRQWTRIDMSGFPNSVLVFRVDELLRPKVSALHNIAKATPDDVALRTRRLLIATDAADTVKDRAAAGNVALLLPPEDKVRDLIGSDIADDALLKAVLAHFVYVADLERAVAGGEQSTLVPTLSGTTISIGGAELPTACFTQKKRFVVAAFDGSSQTISVYLVPNIVTSSSTALDATVATSCHVGAEPLSTTSPEANTAIDLTALEQKARTALAEATSPAEATAALDSLAASFRALGGPDVMRKLYTEAAFAALVVRVRESLNSNLKLSSDEKFNVLAGTLFSTTTI